MIDIFNMVFEALNAIFSPLLALDPNPQNPALTVLVIAFIVSLITTIANKLLVALGLLTSGGAWAQKKLGKLKNLVMERN